MAIISYRPSTLNPRYLQGPKPQTEFSFNPYKTPVLTQGANVPQRFSLACSSLSMMMLTPMFLPVVCPLFYFWYSHSLLLFYRHIAPGHRKNTLARETGSRSRPPRRRNSEAFEDEIVRKDIHIYIYTYTHICIYTYMVTRSPAPPLPPLHGHGPGFPPLLWDGVWVP